MKRIVLTFGLISGAILSALLTLTMAIGTRLGTDTGMLEGTTGMLVGYTTMLLSFLLVYFGVRTYRDTQGGGSVRFWPAFRVGFMISLIASVCYAATWQVVYRTMLPDFAEKYAASTLKKAAADGATPAELEAQRKQMDDFQTLYKNPFANFGMTLLEPLPVALLVSLISAGVLSRRRRDAGLSTLGNAVS